MDVLDVDDVEGDCMGLTMMVWEALSAVEATGGPDWAFPGGHELDDADDEDGDSCGLTFKVEDAVVCPYMASTDSISDCDCLW